MPIEALSAEPNRESSERIVPAHPHSAIVVKRLLDIVGAALAIVVLAPVFIVIAVMVKLGDRGPIIHRRRVIGMVGDFDAFKFRSMRPDADEILARNPELRREFEKNFKLQNDPRITRVGALLRKYSLDELPQLFNVLFGQMSLVGPRMITAPELVKYGSREDLLRTVKPGVTGFWQVNGRQQVAFNERVEMDINYIENWSLLLDLKILIRTPWKVLKGQGAC
jgi:lipopolysaccharide/colanic/teichoic acid biosynthesis glycosyltransferase